MRTYSKTHYFGIGPIPIGIGALIKGWDLTEEEFRDHNRLPVVDFRAMANACPHDCPHCFTDKNEKTISLDEIKEVIDQLAEFKTKAIQFLGEGEPTYDKDFFPIIEYTATKGITPIVYTDGLKFMNSGLARRYLDSGGSLMLKCDSLLNKDYQNWMVGDKKGCFFGERNIVLKLLIGSGFTEKNEDGTTRLGLDMVLSKSNQHEVASTLRYARDNNVNIIFTTFLPAGRSGRADFDNSLSLNRLELKRIKQTIQEIDTYEYGYFHGVPNNFMTASCRETIQIYGNGDVSPCTGNETIIGNIRDSSISALLRALWEKFPAHHPCRRNGQCLYRPKL
jgi:MoaA/NifB/PqqE/SkfB family radical SAM enzyme